MASMIKVETRHYICHNCFNIFLPQTKYAAHGYGGFFTTALMDRHYRSDMTKQQAYKLMIECVKEVQKRLVLNLPNFAVVVVDKEGVTNMDTINPQVIANAA